MKEIGELYEGLWRLVFRLALCCMKIARRVSYRDRFHLGNADIVRATEFQHAIERFDHDIHFAYSVARRSEMGHW